MTSDIGPYFDSKTGFFYFGNLLLYQVHDLVDDVIKECSECGSASSSVPNVWKLRVSYDPRRMVPSSIPLFGLSSTPCRSTE